MELILKREVREALSTSMPVPVKTSSGAGDVVA